MARRVGIIPHLYARPLFEKILREHDSFHVVKDHAAQLAQKLRQGELDGAFLSPVDYAKEYSHYNLVPSVAVSSEGESRTAVLAFKEGLHTIQSVAVDVQSSSEIVLTHLVLAEKYDVVPKIIPVGGRPEAMLKKADAALLVGDAALDSTEEFKTLDLVDEWSDMTGMPYVHGMWVISPERMDPPEVRFLIDSASYGKEHLARIAENRFPDYLEQFRYDIDDQIIDALTEFYQMAYFHGILKDIPDLKFYSLEK